MLYDRNKNYIPVASSSETEPIVINLLETYLRDNPKTGYLVFQVYQNSPLQGILPVVNVKITVSKLLGDDYYVSKVVMTDIDGKTEPIPLPTVNENISQNPGKGKGYSTYDASVEAPNFQKQDISDIKIFEGITSINPVNLVPSVADNNQQVYSERPEYLYEERDKYAYN